MQVDANPNTPDAGDPEPLKAGHNRWLAWATPALSVAILAVVVWQFRHINLNEIVAVIPTNPLFWVVFLVYFFAGPVADFIIFRRLWGIPFEGFIALLRKSVSNALLVDYLGEAYFYSWARKKMNMVTSPFGAVKDVAILSALVSNVVTIVMMVFAYPYAHQLNLGVSELLIAGSIGIVAVVSILVVAFGKRLFSLTRSQLWWVSGVHVARLVSTNLLLALAWSLALPDVALSWWLVLVTINMLLSRLPLISNKDVIFAGLVVFLVGRDDEVKLLMALMATLVLLANITVGVVLALGDLVTVNRGPKEEDV
ncbi:MAG: hypothetical protein ABI898_02830 [Sphingomonadales bacterium]